MKIILILLLFSNVCVASICHNKNVRRVVFLIPGAGSSGEYLYINPTLNKILNLVNQDKYFTTFKRELTELGIDVFICPTVEHFDRYDLKARSEQCVVDIKIFLRKEKGKSKRKIQITLLGHSMGGLVARMVSQNDTINKYIKNVITISTPYKGSVIADFILAELIEGGIYCWIISALGFTPEKRNYLRELTSHYQRNIKNVLSIKYYNITTGTKKISWDTYFTGNIIEDYLNRNGTNLSNHGDLNDGMISTYSQSFLQRSSDSSKLANSTNLKNLLVGHLEISHFESACVDLYKDTDGCFEILILLKKLFKDKICY